MRLYSILILLLILNLFFVGAEEFNIQKNKPLIYKNIQINLLSVGNSGTIRISIQGQERLIEKNKEIIIFDINIKNLEAEYALQTARLDLKLTAECLIDEDCVKLDPCKKSICNYRSCEFSETTQGCVLKDQCRPVGSFEEINNQLSYCSESLTWEPRKSYKSTCKNNYECLSNSCNGKCSTLLSGGKKMAPAWILIIIGGLLLLEALFIFLRPNSAKKIIKDISFWSSKSLKIIALIEIIVALVLIIWAVI